MTLDLSYDNIVSLINTVSESSLTNFCLEYNQLKIVMEVGNPDVAVRIPSEAQTGLTQPMTVRGYTEEIPQKVQTASTQLSTVSTNTVEKPLNEEPGWPIKAPLVGTFYRGPEDKAPPFVSVGDVVKKGQTLGIIDSMKIFNEIESDVDGVVEKILAENGQAVGYNDTLFVISV